MVIMTFIQTQNDRALYVATSNCGLVKITGLPTSMPPPVGSVLSAEGKINLLRVHDVGSKYGPLSDQLDVEVVVWIDTEPNKAFGFKLREGANHIAQKGMLDLLRDSFNSDRKVRIEYSKTGCTTGEIFRVIELY